MFFASNYYVCFPILRICFYSYCSHFDIIQQASTLLPPLKMPFCSSIPKNLPDFIIEVTSNNFRKGSKTVMDSSYLSNNWETLKIYRIPPFLAGTYLLYDLHKNPHYMLNHNQRKQFQKQTNSKNIEIYDVIQSTTEIKNEIYHYTHESNVYKQHVLPYEKEFCLPQIIKSSRLKRKFQSVVIGQSIKVGRDRSWHFSILWKIWMSFLFVYFLTHGSCRN